MKRIGLILTCLITIFLLSSCRSLDYADKYENVKWTSVDPVIEFTVINKTDEFNEGTLKVSDKTVDILCCWSLTNALSVYYKDLLEKELEENDGISRDSIAFHGSYKIKKGVVTLTVDLDNVYDNKYETITFTMTEL